MRNTDSVVMSYLLGSQASEDFESLTSPQLCDLLNEQGPEEAMDVLLTALAVKIRQVEEGALPLCYLKGFLDEVAELRSGILDIDITDAVLTEEVQIMNQRLYGSQALPQAA